MAYRIAMYTRAQTMPALETQLHGPKRLLRDQALNVIAEISKMTGRDPKRVRVIWKRPQEMHAD